MNTIKFYIMPDSTALENSLFLQAVCQIIARHYHLKERVFVLAEDQLQAEAIDELLWQMDPDEFIAHNLVGEGPRGGAPVEIGWQPSMNRRTTLIHLQQAVAPNLQNYQHVVDFVPADEAGKQQARERYKVYRRLGLTPQTEPYQDDVADPS
ncbi:DNA polymerase III subunit chi [Celerinatantimonas sp. YJH-8]|uniref:DNA polymerase III subunit chi n=1 Tax=Celerinatantimonas sp. YJH-8 TaxID=3228714 RepID=UPI0038BF5C32